MTDIKTLGVLCDGTCETEKIQNAINLCAEKGEVLEFTEGVYYTASLELKNNSHLYLNENAVIKASENENDWENCNHKPLINAVEKENITIEGKGKIDCSGDKYHDFDGNRSLGWRPETTINFQNSKNIKLYDFTAGNSVAWTVHFNDCEYVGIERVILRNPDWWCGKSNDGFDINGCRHVKIKDCDVEVGDDGICLKNYHNGEDRKPMFDILVTDCIVRSTCGALKIGTETQGDIYDVRIENIKIEDHRNPNIFRHPDFGGHSLTAISIHSNDGAHVHDITFKNIHATYANTGIFIFLQKRYMMINNPNQKKAVVLKEPKMGKISNILIDGLTVEHAQRANQINVGEGGLVENVKIKNVNITVYEDNNGDYEAIVPESRSYPDGYAYGHMPAYSLFARRVKNLSYEENIRVRDVFNTGRPAIIVEP